MVLRLHIAWNGWLILADMHFELFQPGYFLIRSMPKFAANLSMMYNEHAFLDRVAAAAKDGFSAVEFLFPYDYDPADLQARFAATGVLQILFNCPPGDWDAGERGIASLPGREDEFKQSIEQALRYSDALGTSRLHVMAGLVADEKSRRQQRDVYLRNLEYAARQAMVHDVTLLIEPINTRDMPGYLLNQQDDAQAICRQVGATNLKVQFDIYHCQIVEGDVSTKLRRDLNNIGHIQVAGVPDSHEPNTGDLNYPHLFQLLDDMEYDGWVGCEYRPRNGTSNGLGWIKPWLNKSTSAIGKTTL